MITTIELGKRAEEAAEFFLRKNGCEILARNYRTKRGEIDLIAKEGSILVFVEVRSRGQGAWQTAVESVDFRKQRKIILAARQYLTPFQAKKDFSEIRFDVISVWDGRVLEHIKGWYR